ncbi:MAG: phage head-tail connector protein [Lysinibacillus sp.]
MTQLERFKLQLGISNEGKDVLLNMLLYNAEEFIKSYTYRSNLIQPLLSLQLQIAVIYFNRIGVEGEQGRSEGGISSTIYVLNDDLPTSIKAQLNNYRLLKAARYAT